MEAALGVLGMLALVLIARFTPNAEIGFVLQMMGSGGAIGLLVAYAKHRNDPSADRWRTVTLLTLVGLGVGLALVTIDHLSSVP